MGENAEVSLEESLSFLKELSPPTGMVQMTALIYGGLRMHQALRLHIWRYGPISFFNQSGKYVDYPLFGT